MLIDGLVARHTTQTGQKIDPAATYDAAPQSARTTFDSVTHALLSTKLTNEEGKPLGTAFDAIEALEEIAGESASNKFRLYVLLKPSARDLLDRSREFHRVPDNLVSRIDYPVCYQLEGTPSIRFSLVPDGKSGEVAVEYRSSNFPDGLLNGYLASSNSDVRAGKNQQKHNARWNGLMPWWTDIFSSADPPQKQASGAFPKVTKQKIEDSAQDFYQAWLVNGAPQVAASYFSRQVYGCAEQGERAHNRQLDRGMTWAYLVRGLESYSEASDMKSIPPWDATLKVIQHKASSRFLLAQVDARFAEAHDCSRLANPTEMPRREGTFYVTAARMQGEKDVVFLWAEDSDLWRIIAYYVLEKEIPTVFTRVTAAPAATEPALMVDGDPELARALRDFLRRWLVKQNPDQALEYFLPDAIACAAENDPAWQSRPPGALRRRLVSGMNRIANDRAKDSARTVAPAVRNAGIRTVRHRHEDDFLIVSVSDQSDGLFRCGSPLPKEELRRDLSQTATFGNIYVSAIQLKNVEGQPGALLTAWRKTPDGWRIFWWKVEMP